MDGGGTPSTPLTAVNRRRSKVGITPEEEQALEAAYPYDLPLMQEAEATSSDGPMGFEAAKRIWQQACQNSAGISDKGWSTLEHIVAELPLDKMAELFLKQALKTGSKLRESPGRLARQAGSPAARGRRASTGGSPSSPLPQDPVEKEKTIERIQEQLTEAKTVPQVERLQKRLARLLQGDGPRFKKGQRVTLEGVDAEPEINGLSGELLEFDVKAGRWVVLLEGIEDSERRVLPMHLTPSKAKGRLSIVPLSKKPAAADDEDEDVEDEDDEPSVKSASPTVIRRPAALSGLEKARQAVEKATALGQAATAAREDKLRAVSAPARREDDCSPLGRDSKYMEMRKRAEQQKMIEQMSQGQKRPAGRKSAAAPVVEEEQEEDDDDEEEDEEDEEDAEEEEADEEDVVQVDEEEVIFAPRRQQAAQKKPAAVVDEVDEDEDVEDEPQPRKKPAAAAAVIKRPAAVVLKRPAAANAPGVPAKRMAKAGHPLVKDSHRERRPSLKELALRHAEAPDAAQKRPTRKSAEEPVVKKKRVSRGS